MPELALATVSGKLTFLNHWVRSVRLQKWSEASARKPRKLAIRRGCVLARWARRSKELQAKRELPDLGIKDRRPPMRVRDGLNFLVLVALS
ncbi:hypothetical protein AS156_35890 [Bradyrhizobium macuxiense]|uniref:Uncharacterized protein n=1 Tax=Bradyrhizobium macuxiense TaxID=1755647 RepID=A0A109K020_9BRAD|nr:hypothetical protein AS156_35890 [Bradyrhizobium macuxiense]